MKIKDREKYGKRAFYVAVIGNLFLTIFNITVGVISGSFALVSEGAHTVSDLITSIIAYAGFKIANKPADADHPYGHGRAEAIAGLVIVIFLVVVAYQILVGAFLRLFVKKSLAVPDSIAVVMAILGIFINLAMSQRIINRGHSANSPAIVADGKHQRVDIFSSLAILLGLLVCEYGYPQLDSIIGLFIALLIGKTALNIARENINAIMGKVPSQELVDDIERAANSVEGVYGTHNIRVNYLGSYATVTLHIDLPGDMTVEKSHEISHKVQDKIVEEVEVIRGVTVHACPLGVEYDHNQDIDIIE